MVRFHYKGSTPYKKSGSVCTLYLFFLKKTKQMSKILTIKTEGEGTTSHKALELIDEIISCDSNTGEEFIYENVDDAQIARIFNKLNEMIELMEDGLDIEHYEITITEDMDVNEFLDNYEKRD